MPPPRSRRPPKRLTPSDPQSLCAAIAIAAPYVLSAGTGIIFLFASAGARSIRLAGWGVVAGGMVTIAIACGREAVRLSALTTEVPVGQSVFSYLDPVTMIGAATALVATCFALRVAISGNAAFATAEPKRIRGKRAMHGEPRALDRSSWRRGR